MKVLIIYAHQEAKSFNGAMRDTAVETFTNNGDRVKVSDLYAMNFNRVIKD
ncbi:MAG: NAD(P)H-dependent oxidoreductase [Prochloraceae cyanobacterium]